IVNFRTLLSPASNGSEVAISLESIRAVSKRSANLVYGFFLGGKKKQSGLPRQEVNNSNPFDALNLVENDDDMGMNGRNSKLAEKRDTSCVVSSDHGTSSEAFGKSQASKGYQV
nr:hypothetical protein [Tanacetum cinerariifolium]